MDLWKAYKCTEPEVNYEMLIIENMDADTEARRLSSVTILGDQYIDLINGPQDHGWCSGYTCRKRVSTFMSLVATGKNKMSCCHTVQLYYWNLHASVFFAVDSMFCMLEELAPNDCGLT